ncbi:hypothetical protein C8A00DRAFT_39182 [Chaetomidium leptoderma]|uniref:DUS-like FMN-binding domain-containing protein n=1 Tax=Chaetomidium leptoderma TaxID=669021 RepID=A0AAN6VVA9_9PEZI|nr:hypothetical protein C8A00DRAFT_39182 [Chaetomidium leptoderma]
MATAEETAATAAVPTRPTTLPRVPIPPRGVDYRGKVVLAPMVRSGELPSRLLALHYGADLVWGPETVDHSLIGATRRTNPRTGMIEYTRQPSHSHSPANNNTHDGSGSGGVAESVIYRLDPARERGKLVFQLGTSDAARAVAAARFVAADVAGIDVNAGCPKPFSVTGGMGAALLQTPEKLAGILEALVREIVPEFNIGISVKIRLLETAPETEALVRRLVRTGITGLTVHCRTTPMRPRERAIRGQLGMVASLCREAGVACLMNGDVESRDQADGLVKEFGVDGAMIATAAEKNPSCFRPGAVAAAATWQEVVERYLRLAMEVENKIANTKFMLAQMITGKAAAYKAMHQCRSYVEFVQALGHEGAAEMARETDRVLGLGEFEVKPEPKQNNKQNQQQKQQQQKQKQKHRQQQGSNKRKRGKEEQEGAKEGPVKRVADVVESAPAPVAAANSDTLGGSTSALLSFRRWKSTNAMAVFSGSKQQHLAALSRQELLAQPAEPPLPKRLCLRQIGPPPPRAQASSVTTAPPREWPTSMIGGRAGQCMADWVRVSTARRSDARVGRVRSSTTTAAAPSLVGGEAVVVVVVRPWPRASRDRIPAVGKRFLISAPRTANERPDEPAPWWVTNNGPGDLPGSEAGAGEVR